MRRRIDFDTSSTRCARSGAPAASRSRRSAPAILGAGCGGLIASTGDPYTGEVLDRALEIVQAVVVLFTPDDLVRLRHDLQADHERDVSGQRTPERALRSRAGVRRHPNRTVIVEYGRLRGLSDLFGRHAVRLERGVPALQDLAARLRTVGCAIKTGGSDWLDTSDFPRAAQPPGRALKVPVFTEPAMATQTPASTGPLARLVGEILDDALGRAAADDVVAHITGCGAIGMSRCADTLSATCREAGARPAASVVRLEHEALFAVRIQRAGGHAAGGHVLMTHVGGAASQRAG